MSCGAIALTISPGNSVGVLTVSGDAPNDFNGIIAIEVEGVAGASEGAMISPIRFLNFPVLLSPSWA